MRVTEIENIQHRLSDASQALRDGRYESVELTVVYDDNPEASVESVLILRVPY